MSNINMLGPSLMHMIIGYINGTCIITKNLEWTKRHTKISKLLFEPDKLEQQAAAAMYSASVVESATEVCFLEP